MNRFLLDLRERFYNGETLKGIVLLFWGVYGLTACWISRPDGVVQNVIDGVADATLPWWILIAGIFLYLTYEGIRKIWVNRIKQRIEQERLMGVHRGISR